MTILRFSGHDVALAILGRLLILFAPTVLVYGLATYLVHLKELALRLLAQS